MICFHATGILAVRSIYPFKQSPINMTGENMVQKGKDIIWLNCPDCGSKIGIILTVGKTLPTVSINEEKILSPKTIEDLLTSVGVDINLIDIKLEKETILIRPRKFLGDLWGAINDSIRSLDGVWIRDGRNSHWKLDKTILD